MESFCAEHAPIKIRIAAQRPTRQRCSLVRKRSRFESGSGLQTRRPGPQIASGPKPERKVGITQNRRIAGLGGIAFAVCLVLGFTFFGPRGARYSAAATANFVGQSPTNVLLSTYLFAVSIIGLIVLMAYLSDTCFGAGRYARITWGTSLAAAASFLSGWSLYFAIYTSVNSGGPSIDPAISYTFLNVGFVVLFGVTGILLGIALLTIAIGGHSAPPWVRASSAIAGLSAFLSWAFLIVAKWSPNHWLPVPFYFVVFWGLVIGVWLLVSSPRLAAQTRQC